MFFRILFENLKYSQLVIFIFKYLLIIIPIYNALFSIILHIHTIIFQISLKREMIVTKNT